MTEMLVQDRLIAVARRIWRTGLLINAAVAAGYLGAKAWDEISRKLYLSGL
jgi:hypothetical protein